MLTLNFVNSFGSQSKVSSRLYPPCPGRPASPLGLGICCSSSASESLSTESTSDWEDSEDMDQLLCHAGIGGLVIDFRWLPQCSMDDTGSGIWHHASSLGFGPETSWRQLISSYVRSLHGIEGSVPNSVWARGIGRVRRGAPGSKKGVIGVKEAIKASIWQYKMAMWVGNQQATTHIWKIQMGTATFGMPRQ